MVQTVAITEAITNLQAAHEQLGIERATAPDFFWEWQDNLPVLTPTQQGALDRYRDRYLTYAADGMISEGTVQVIMVSPLLELLGLCDPPRRIQGERYVEVAIENDQQVLRGRIDVLVIQQRLWLAVVEAKHFGFSVLQAIPQTLAYMMGRPQTQATIYGLITTGEDYLFLKLQRSEPAQYALSHKFTLLSDADHGLYQVARILQRLADPV
ncbi:MAG: type I restriction endonuclease subunit R [Leptolyngbya sp. RL_3_1]|nr:type I restriction endonuclease subunit R [Leptolyngbya sp. RL_3_1]